MSSTRITELENLITRYATSYYSGISEVSDEYFDSLVDELKELNPESSVLTTGWGYSPEKRKVSHKHGLYIGSLSKIKTTEDIDKKYNKYTRVSAKLDGLSVVSYYEDGKRVLCVTRGNGEEGQDITNHMNLIDPIFDPIRNLDGSLFTGAIRGEVVIPMVNWECDETLLKIQEDNPSANPRNIASGLLNRKELTEEDASCLAYVTYKVLYSEGFEYKTTDDVTSFLISEMKYCAPFECAVDFSNESTLKEIYDKWCKFYPCDGLVLTNMTGNCEYDEVAFKFQAESKIVTVKGIEYSATRTGRIVPTVTFDPVELSGAMVSRASGFNAAFIRDSKIGPGAEIEVCRSGEVIPHIMSIVKPCEEGYLPEVCPHCGNKLVWKNTDLICNAENESQMPYTALTILAPLDGAGDAIYSTIVKSLNLYSVNDFEDFLYNLNNFGVDEILEHILKNSDLSGEVTIGKVRSILQKLSGAINIKDAIVACSIPGVSDIMAEKICSAYPEILMDAQRRCIDNSKLYEINGVGDSIVNALNTFKNRLGMMIGALEIVIPEKKAEPEVQFKVAITGKLSVKRSVFEDELKQHGFIPSDIKKDTKYLITDNPNSSSSKNRLADEWGIMKITEQDFRNQFMND